MQGTPSKLTTITDLDALLKKRALKPKKVKFGGHVYKVRTDLTGKEISEYFKLAGDKQDREALALLVGDEDAERLNDALEGLPAQHMTLAVREFMVAAEIVNGVSESGEDAEGESSAS